MFRNCKFSRLLIILNKNVKIINLDKIFQLAIFLMKNKCLILFLHITLKIFLKYFVKIFYFYFLLVIL